MPPLEMAPVYDKIFGINPIRDNWNVLARVIRLWSTRGGGQITGIYFILMDDQGSRIQATVRKHLAPKYENLIREGVVYAIKNFTLANNTGGFRVANHEYKITIQGETIALLQSDSLVPPTIWDFVKYDDVFGALDESLLLLDVIGMLSRVGEQRNFGGGKKMKQIVLDNFGVELTCSFWGHYIDKIDQFLTANDPTNAIVVIMCGKIKEFQGRRTIQNGLHCCKILFSLTFPVALEFKNKMLLSIPNPQQGVGHIVDASQVSLEDDFLNFHERKTLAELKDPTIDAYMLDLQGWWYNVCSCNKPVQPDSVSYYCGPCDRRVVNVQTRYRIRIKVIDETDSIFVIFDRPDSILLKRSCSDSITSCEKTAAGVTCPVEIVNLLDRRLLFKVEIKKDSDGRFEPSYTVKRATDHGEILAKFRVAAPPKDNDTSVQSASLSKCSMSSKNLSMVQPLIGDGCSGTNESGEYEVSIPDELLIKESGDPLQDLVDFAYPKLLQNMENSSFFEERVILCPTLDAVQMVNDYILSTIPGHETEYLSADKTCVSDDDAEVRGEWFTTEFLNDIKCSGVPNHVLKLKKNTPIMLIRNIDQYDGLCNGTRLIVKELLPNVIGVRVVTRTNVKIFGSLE
ncbi:hypothetical protein OROGR_024822 [Orobanche gracilis]